jgi:hypothetical protein
MFFLMIEGSGAGSGTVSQTNGSGSGRPKSIWILLIQFRNTGHKDFLHGPTPQERARYQYTALSLHAEVGI